MEPSHDVIQLERQAWTALSSAAPAARDFFEAMLGDEALMLLPGGLVLTDRAEILDSMSGPPWARFRLDDIRVVALSATSAIVAYRAVAQRGDQAEYVALISSAYQRSGDDWRLVFHQQTPV